MKETYLAHLGDIEPIGSSGFKYHFYCMTGCSMKPTRGGPQNQVLSQVLDVSKCKISKFVVRSFKTHGFFLKKLGTQRSNVDLYSLILTDAFRINEGLFYKDISDSLGERRGVQKISPIIDVNFDPERIVYRYERQSEEVPA